VVNRFHVFTSTLSLGSELRWIFTPGNPERRSTIGLRRPGTALVPGLTRLMEQSHESRFGEPPSTGVTQQLDRRQFLTRAGAVLVALPGAYLLAACGDHDGMMGRRMPDWMMSGAGMMDAEMMEDMRVIHQLLQSHDRIRRNVEDVPTGIRARTTSRDPEIAELIRVHVSRMKTRVRQGDPIRLMDPVFREIFEHHAEVAIDVEPIPGGVLVVETSTNRQVELLIRQHAHRAVSEFVAEGMARAMRPTPLPRGYGRN
jgi:hypothetical protein